ncbi:heme NO-binding domain-containing protein [Vibrio alfacsensis]|uniref:heme NO-binding domain-containing protein n=1 Tax=Vibrio alfacsensis TaxID=1074311 RepID=UPI001BEE7216|nr:heme NO-binding domain-containing protein [Vibrio alfacsensis]BCN24121.1 guanylate cyclase [Vibrio alfacsensis]
MKGIIFTEFMELVESHFGLEVLDQVLEASHDEGIYTSVGSYDHRSLVKLIVNLSKTTDIPAEKLQEIFGETVFLNLLRTIPPQASLVKSDHCFQFIRHVEEYIHVEVKKLYPDAEPPRFEFISETETHLVMNYKSARCMSHVCFGLIKGCAKYFNQTVDIEMEPLNASGSEVKFNVTLK